MRILLASLNYFGDRPGGADRLVWREALWLRDRGHSVAVTSFDASARRAPHERIDGIDILRYTLGGGHSGRVALRSRHPSAVAARLRQHWENAPDIVHAHNVLIGAGALGAWPMPAGRHAISLHSPAFEEAIAGSRNASLALRIWSRVRAHALRRLECDVMRRSHAVLANSAFTRSCYPAAVRDRIEVVPGWIDAGDYEIAPDKLAAKRRLGWPDTPTFLTVRRLVPRMGLERLIVAFARLKALGHVFHAVIAGTGPLAPALERLVSEHGLSSQVRFQGFVADAELRAMYAAADAFVLPTAELECFGLIVIESLAAGTPVLATPVAAIPELIDRIEPAWLARSASAEAIAALLESFLARRLPVHPPERLRDFVLQRYTGAICLPQIWRAISNSPAATP